MSELFKQVGGGKTLADINKAHDAEFSPAVTEDAGDFEESKHPRADNGQFGKGSGGGKNSASSTSGGTMNHKEEFFHHNRMAQYHENKATKLFGVPTAEGRAKAAKHEEAIKLHRQAAEAHKRAETGTLNHAAEAMAAANRARKASSELDDAVYENSRGLKSDDPILGHTVKKEDHVTKPNTAVNYSGTVVTNPDYNNFVASHKKLTEQGYVQHGKPTPEGGRFYKHPNEKGRVYVNKRGEVLADE